jgi:hypothetical protein
MTMTDKEILAAMNSVHQNGPLWHTVYPLHRAIAEAAFAAGVAAREGSTGTPGANGFKLAPDLQKWVDDDMPNEDTGQQ